MDYDDSREGAEQLRIWRAAELELRQAATDARQIIAWRAAGYSLTQRNCEGMGCFANAGWGGGAAQAGAGAGRQVASADTFLIEDVGECAERSSGRCGGWRL